MNELPEASREAMIGDLEQMDSIVRQFLDYAVPTPQRGAEEVDLSALVREALVRNRLLAPTGGGTGGTEADASVAQFVQLTADVQPGIFVLGHRTELARTLDNLLNNAQRYGRCPDGSLQLEIRLHGDGTEAVLMVADHGPGIAPQEISRLVRPFERGDPSRSGAVGAGLGLAIVERVVRIHGARLDFHRNEPTGLRIELRLPARTRPTEALPAAGSTPP